MPVGINRELRKLPFLTAFYSFLCVAIFVGNRYFASSLPIDFYNFIYIPGASPLLSAIAAAFLHFGYMHIIGNLVYLLLFGRYVEDAVGPAAYAFLFMSSAFVGNYLQGVYNFHVLHEEYMGIIGASGAISGIMGAFAVRFLTSKLKIGYWVFFPLQAFTRAGFVEVPSILAILFWFLLQVANGLVELGGTSGQVAYVTHLSSFAWGVTVALALGQLRKGRLEALMKKADAAFKRGDVFAAQAHIVKYLGDAPDDGDAYASLARVQLLGGDRTTARKNYANACRCFLGRMERGRAEDIYREALHGFPNMVLDPETQLDMAFGLERNLKPEQALAAYRNFATAYPAHSEAPFALLRAANLLVNNFMDHPGAAECYELLVKRYPEDEWADFAREQLRLLSAYLSA
jgi:membrane associated rhomboid family serine protease